MLKRILFMAIISLIAALASVAQVTSSSISGNVKKS